VHLNILITLPTLTLQPQDTYTPLPTYTPQDTYTPLPTPTPTDTPTDTPTITPTPTSAVPCYNLTIKQRGSGDRLIPSKIRSNGCPLEHYIEGEFITLNAQPSPGWKVEGWQGTADDSQKTHINELIMPAANHKVEVIYQMTRLASNCRSLTPPGAPLPATCLVGIVYLDGRPLADVDVEITNQAAESKIIRTEIKENSADPRPHFRIPLDDPAFPIQVGQPIDLRVVHDNLEITVPWVAQIGHQQVDIVLSSAEGGRPIGTIGSVSIENGILTALGMGISQEQGSEIISYLWHTNHKNEPLGKSAKLILPVTELQPGRHQLTFQAEDSQGSWSEPIITDIYVAHNPATKWVMLLYLAGDYNDSDQQWNAFQKALHKLKGLDDRSLRIVAQVDGANRPAQRWIIEPGQDPAQEPESIGEVAMDDPQTLIEFIEWGQAKFPSDNYYLAIADHGQAVRGIAWDAISDLTDNGIPDNSAYMTVKELGEALNSPTIAPINVLHLDACSMNLIEVAYEIGERTDVMISSQYLGWDYFTHQQGGQR